MLSDHKQQYPKHLYVTSVSGSLGPNHTPETAREDFEQLMSRGGESYGYLVATGDSCWGIIGYVDEHWTPPTETEFLHGPFEVQCTHQFVEKLRKLWNQTKSARGRRFLLYKNLKTKMTNKSCNNFCLRNIQVKEERLDLPNEDDVLQEAVEEYLCVD